MTTPVISSIDEEITPTTFSVTDLVGTTTYITTHSIRDLRLKLALETDVFHPCITLVRQEDGILIQDGDTPKMPERNT